MLDKRILEELLNMPVKPPLSFRYNVLRANVLALAEEYDTLSHDVQDKDRLLALQREQVEYLQNRLATYESGRDPMMEFAQEVSSTMKLVQELDDHLERADTQRKNIALELILHLEDKGQHKAARILRKKENL